jgi:hypothetical protein
MRPERLSKWKIPMIPSGIEPGNFRLVAQSINELCHLRTLCAVLPTYFKTSLGSSKEMCTKHTT